MVGQLPETWIPPEHLLDLRARVRLRHTLVDQRGEWQQRIQAVLYHHGVAQRRDLLTAGKRGWLGGEGLPAAAREQTTVALRIIDALDAESAPLTRELRAYGRRQPGCRALMRHYGIGALTALTILAELATRTGSPRRGMPFATPAWTSPSTSPTSAGLPGICPASARPRCAGRSMRRRGSPGPPAPPTRPPTNNPSFGSGCTLPAWPSPSSCSS